MINKPYINYTLQDEDYGNYIVLKVSIKCGRDMPTNLDMLDTVINVVAPDIREKSTIGKMTPLEGNLW